MAEYLRSYIYYSFDSLTKYDYMAIGWILFLALLLLILAAVVKKRVLSYLSLLAGLLLLFAGPPTVKSVLDGYLREADIEVERVKRLNYSSSLIIEGEIKNVSELDFSHCDLAVSIYRPASNVLDHAAAVLKPITVKIERMDSPIARSETKPFRIIVDHFSTQEFNLTVQPRCYP